MIHLLLAEADQKAGQRVAPAGNNPAYDLERPPMASYKYDDFCHTYLF
jgi:hypothetical protein